MGRAKVDLSPLVWLIVIVLSVSLIGDLAREIKGPENAPGKPTFWGQVFRWVLRKTVFEGDQPAQEAATDEPKRTTPAEPPRRAIAGGQEIPDFAEGW